MDTPVISIVIPTWNRAHLLGQTLDSLRQQTFTRWEAIVVDDGSSDRTIELLRHYQQIDARIRYQQPHSVPRGAPVCRNLGTQQARGRYLIYMDSDDLLAPSALARRFRMMEADPQLDFAVFPCVLFRQDPQDSQLLMHPPSTRERCTSSVDFTDLDQFLACHLPWQTMGPIWRRSAIERLGHWDESLLSWQDVEFHVRALITGMTYCCLDTPDYFWRIHQTTSVTSFSESPEHLANHLIFLQRIHQQLQAADLLTPDRKRYLVRIFFWLTDRWARIGRRQEADQVWKLAGELDLLSSSQSFQHGLLYIQINCLALWAWLGLRRPIHRLCWEVWRQRYPDLILRWSSSFMKTPLDRAVEWPNSPEGLALNRKLKREFSPDPDFFLEQS